MERSLFYPEYVNFKSGCLFPHGHFGVEFVEKFFFVLRPLRAVPLVPAFALAISSFTSPFHQVFCHRFAQVKADLLARHIRLGLRVEKPHDLPQDTDDGRLVAVEAYSQPLKP